MHTAGVGEQRQVPQMSSLDGGTHDTRRGRVDHDQEHLHISSKGSAPKAPAKPAGPAAARKFKAIWEPVP